jgi:sRNA-binding regulator protein Hfq
MTNLKKIIVCLSFILLSVTYALAQKNKVHVLLNNGAVLRGTIETDATKNVTLKSKSNVWVIPKSDIDTIVGSKRKLPVQEIYTPWFFKFGYGVLMGNSENENDAISFFHGTFNYNITKGLFAGGGLGVEYYMEQSYIPVFANFEYRFRDTKFAPFVFLKGGYMVRAEKQQNRAVYKEHESRNLHPKYLKSDGGAVLSPGIGFISMLGPNFGLSFSAGYRYHALKFSGKEEYELEQRYNRLSLTLGIIFK